jgi:lactate dehydrogenase-like 2-hydroxyacid dehydrogenase
LEYLAEHCELRVWDGDLQIPADQLRLEVAECNGLLALLTDRVDDELLAAAPGLRVVSNMATGFDNVDVPAATQRGVLVTRTPGVLSETTADFAFTLLLAAARRLVEADRYVRKGEWKTWGPETLLGHDVYDTTIGIVGMGGIGREMAKRATGFGMRILYNSRERKPDLEQRYSMSFATIDDLLAESDFITLHAPLTDQTRHLIDERALKLMKPTAVLVNTARGPLVDQEALYQALNEGWIAAAGLDVTDPEPMPPDDPLLTLRNLIIAPHIASASVATRSRMAMMAAEQLVEALVGRKPYHAVNPEAWAGKAR